jgi:hypothetical protein
MMKSLLIATEPPVRESILSSPTVAAAVIAVIAGWITLYINRRNRISEFRQAWIDGLRTELAGFISQFRTVASFADSMATNLKNERIYVKDASVYREWRDDDFKRSYAPIEEMRRHLASILLRLNPAECLHMRLQRQLTEIVGYLDKSGDDCSFDHALSLLEMLQVTCREILKQEWDRVKKGEGITWRWRWRLASAANEPCQCDEHSRVPNRGENP